MVLHHAIHIKVFSYETFSYLIFFTDDVLNTTNNETTFHGIRRVFEESFGVKVQEVSVIKYLNFWICLSPIGSIFDNTDHIMEVVNEWFPTGKFRKVDTSFSTNSTYEK